MLASLGRPIRLVLAVMVAIAVLLEVVGGTSGDCGGVEMIVMVVLLLLKHYTCFRWRFSLVVPAVVLASVAVVVVVVVWKLLSLSSLFCGSLLLVLACIAAPLNSQVLCEIISPGLNVFSRCT